jgi:hypothetical protein
MRIATLLALVLLLTAAAWAKVLPGKLWSQGDRSVWAVPCGPRIDGDEYCTSMQARQGKQVITSTTGYQNVRLLWQQTRAGTGPAAIVAGDTGGSAGVVDVFAVTFGKSPAFGQVQSDHIAIDQAITVNGLPELDIGFAVDAFNGAPNSQASVARLPLRWNGWALEANLPALLARRVATGDVARLRAEIAHHQKQEEMGFSTGGTPLVADTMLQLVLSGHADRARALLVAGWPREPGRKGSIEAMWEEFCGGVTAQPAWTRFGLSRLPHADLLEASGHRYLVRWSGPQK